MDKTQNKNIINKDLKNIKTERINSGTHMAEGRDPWPYFLLFLDHNLWFITLEIWKTSQRVLDHIVWKKVTTQKKC